MALIPILGVPSTYKVPGQFAEILFAQGPATASAGERTVLLCMPKLAASGTWSANQIYRVRHEKDAEDGAGKGSPLHRGIRAFLKSNKLAKLYALPYLPTVGGAPVAAALDYTYTTDPSATGVTKTTICGEEVSTSFNSADTVTTVATAMKNAINAREWLPVTAASAAGVMTLTAKITGISQGDGTTGAIRVQVEIDSGVGTTVQTENSSTNDALGLGTGTSGAEGTTTEAAALATAIATITASRYYYMGTSVWDATGLGNLQTHVASKSEPIPGLRSVACAAFTGALAAGQTIANARNFERLQVAWQPNSQLDPASIVGNVLGIRQKYESLDSAYNFDFYRNSSDWSIPAAYAEADWPDGSDQNDAINDGLMPIASDGTGSYLVMSVGTRSKDSSGTVDDFRAAETHRVSVADEFTDTLLLRHRLNYGGMKLKDDERLADGTVNNNQRLYPRVITPSAYKIFPKRLLDEFEGIKLQNVPTSKEGLRVERDPNNGGRLEVGLDLHVVDLFHQATFRLAEVSTG